MYPILRKNHSCLHCGKEKGDYCESCFQKLIAENADLQWKSKCLERDVEVLNTLLEIYKKGNSEEIK